MAQRILVLGASGYIGQHLVFALSQQGHQVRAAARARICAARGSSHEPASTHYRRSTDLAGSP
ncbi:NAD-dependent epimerase/dehydratase family protein [Burkholderia thailandensis]|uniref:NAD-dependent epimerase/dehydratase family protein n=1 Tax=Burkholderia thailandensis TaxID=57975 RepID=UPI00217CF7DA|nr:NAD-dependent epimerase/dehydratase family protein [Burkholderia thailandensis]MCS6515064.1 NAD-dependent epimerase/dehydratase family protein [Burkholderia thailandensis]